MSPMQRCISDLVYQPLVTSFVINVYLCLAMLHAWTWPGVPVHDGLHLMVKTYEGRKAMQWSPGEDRRVALATSGSTRFRRMPMPYAVEI